jgi:predicted porin
MNKKLISLAVAAALVAPAAAMAEATLYGKVNVSLDYASVKNVVLPTFAFARNPQGQIIRDQFGNATLVQTSPGEDFDGWGMSSSGYIPGEGRASRIGVKGSEDLGGGLKAIYQVEFGINLNDTNNNVLNNADAITMRNSFVGLAGGWGTFLMGRHDTPMKISTAKLDLFADTMADYNGTVGFQDLRADNAVAYISPSWAGFTFAGAVIPSGGATGGVSPATRYQLIRDNNGNTTGVEAINDPGLNLNDNSIAGAYSLAAIYSNGPFYASLAYEALGNEHFNTQNVSLNQSDCPYTTIVPGVSVTDTCRYIDSDATAWRAGLGLLDWNGFSLTGIYEHRDIVPGNDTYTRVTDLRNPANDIFLPGGPNKTDLWQIQAGYAFGNSQIKAMYGQGSYSGDASVGTNFVAVNGGGLYASNLNNLYDYDTSTWGVGYDYNFSKRTKVYALYTDVTSDQSNVVAGSEWDGFSLGMMHSF